MSNFKHTQTLSSAEEKELKNTQALCSRLKLKKKIKLKFYRLAV